MFKKENINYKVCTHEEKVLQEEAYQIFTGEGTNFIVVCKNCFSKEIDDIVTHTLTDEQYSKLNEEYRNVWIEFKGQAGILSNINPKFSDHIEQFTLQKVNLQDITAYTIVQTTSYVQIFILEKEGILYKIDIQNNIISETFILKLRSWCLVDTEKHISILLSPDTQFMAIYNTRGQYGFVIDIHENIFYLELDRKTYHIEHSVFPVAFFNQEDQNFIIHGSDWNNIELYNLTLEKPMIERKIEYENRETYLDYFYGTLSISPDLKWVVSTGWAWHPIGIIHAFQLQAWFSNPVEAEVGPTVKSFNPMDDWDMNITWLDDLENILGVWGFSPDSFSYIPAFSIWNVEKQELLDWFAGPEPEIAYSNGFLYSWDVSKPSISIWNIKSGEQMYHSENFRVNAFHKNSLSWIALVKDNNLLKVLQIK